MKDSSEKREGNCWLCGRHGRLSLEHIPPQSAFNEHPLLLRQISERTQTTGVLVWDEGTHFRQGLAVRSLCARCNSQAGQRFAPPYTRLVKTVAERIGEVRNRHRFTIQRVLKPQLVLKQVVQQFVTANGPTFVTANPWVRPFLQPESKTALPPEVCVYLFATNMATTRTTGVSGHVHAGANQVRIVSEFTFWPLGTVLSYGELPNEELAPIHHWSRFPYKSSETADITLTANATASAMPLDFRTKDEIAKNMEETASSAPSEASLHEMAEQVFKRGGAANKEGFLYNAHPSAIDLLQKGRA